MTALLCRLREGDRSALDRVVSALYAELRQIVRRRLRGEWGTRLLMTTELVHEAYLRLLGQRQLAVEEARCALRLAQEANGAKPDPRELRACAETLPGWGLADLELVARFAEWR